MNLRPPGYEPDELPTALPRDIMVPVTGLEPVRYFYQGILSPARLPISPHRQITSIMQDTTIPPRCQGAGRKNFKTAPGEKKFCLLASFRAIFPAVRHRMVELFQNAKEERVMPRDGTRDLDDLIFPEEWEISQR